MTSPHTHALRYRIWAYCEPRGWDVTIGEIAEALDLSVSAVSNIVRSARWSSRVRSARLVSDHVSMVRYRAGQRTVDDVVAGRLGVLVDA